MKHRLFLLGDSFVDWPIPINHWTYYLSKHYEIFKLGKSGADNFSIISQLGELPEYLNGDRLLIVFTEPGRLPRRYYGDRRENYKETPYISLRMYKDYDFASRLHVLKYDESERWVNGEREMEIKFLKNLKHWLFKYNPIFTTWSENFHKPTSDFVYYFKVTSNFEEGINEERDFHPGIKGCYELYKIMHNLLEVNEPIHEFEEEPKNLL